MKFFFSEKFKKKSRKILAIFWRLLVVFLIFVLTIEFFSFKFSPAKIKTPIETKKKEGISLTANKKIFRVDEEPEFLIKQKEKNGGVINKFLAQVAPTLKTEPKIQASLIDPKGEKISTIPTIEKVSDNDLKIKISQPQSFRPGVYKLKVDYGGEILEQNFAWGILAINTNKSIYLPGDQVFIQMAALRDDGHTICDARLRLQILNPESEILNLSTEDGTPNQSSQSSDGTGQAIQYSGECGPDNVTDKPDYFAFYQVGEPGIYQMKLTNLDNGYEITDSFEVRDSVPFDVERIGPTRIYPPATYEMTFKIKANQDFIGQVVEQVPAGFEIVEAEQTLISTPNNAESASISVLNQRQSASINLQNDTKQIIWQASWQAGNSYELKYQFDAPDTSPYLYLLGPLELVTSNKQPETKFKELRSWQIASDSPTTRTKTVEYFVGQNYGTSGIASGTGATYDFTVYLPDAITSATVIRSAYIEYNTVISAADASATTFQLGVQGQTLTTLSSPAVIDQAGESQPVQMKLNATSVLQGIIQAAGTFNLRFTTSITGPVRYGENAKLIITYDYNDAATTQVKTVYAWVHSQAATVSSGGSVTSANFNLGLPESSITSRSTFIETWGYVNAALTTGFYWNAETERDIAWVNTTNSYGYVALVSPTNTYSPNTNNTFTIKSVSGAFSAPSAILHYTYSFDYSASTELMNSLRILLFQGTETASTATLSGNKVINIPESGITMKSSFLLGRAVNTNTATMTLGMNAQLGSTPTTTGINFLANAGETDGFRTIVWDVTSNLSTMTTGDNTVYWAYSASAATNIRGLVLFLSYKYNKANSSTFNSQAEWWVGQQTAASTTWSQAFTPSIADTNYTLKSSHLNAQFNTNATTATTYTVGIGTTGAYAFLTTGENTMGEVWRDTSSDVTTLGSQLTATLNGSNNTTKSASFFVWWQVSMITISGTIYQTDESTHLTTQPAMKLAVGASTSYSTTANSDGTFTFSNVTPPSAGTVMTIWLDTGAGTDKASLVFKYGSSCTGYPNCTGLLMYQNRVNIDNKNTGSITNSDLSACDNDLGSACSDTDIGFTSNGALSLTFSTNMLRISSGVTFAPGGNVTCQKLRVAGTYSGGSETLTLEGSGTGTTCGSADQMPLCVDGTFTASSNTTKFIGTSASYIALNSNFYNLEISPAATVTYTLGTGTSQTLTVGGTLNIGDGTNALTLTAAINNPNISVSGATTIKSNATFTIGSGTQTFSGNLTVNGTLNGSGSLTVNGSVTGGGTINLSGGTFLQRVSSNQNFGSDSGSNNWTFNNLTFENSSTTAARTITTSSGGSGQIIISGTLTIGNASDSYSITLDNNTNNRTLDVNGDLLITSKGILQASSSASFYVGGSWSNSGTFTHNNGTVTFDSGSTGKTINPGNSSFYNIVFNNASGSWSVTTNALTVANDLTMTAGTLDNSNGTANITVNGNVTGTAGIINLTASGHNFKQRVSGNKNFGPTTANTDWTFVNLTFSNSSGSSRTITTQSCSDCDITVSGTLTIGEAGDSAPTQLSAGDKTWNLSGGGSSLVFNASSTLSSDNSTFQYSSTSATNIAATTYKHLKLSPSGPGSLQFTINSGNLEVNGDLTIGNGTYPVTVKADTNNPTILVNGAFTIKNGGGFVGGSNNLTVKGNFTLESGSTFTYGSGTLILDGTPTANTFTDNNSTKQNMGKVQIGQSPGETNLGSDLVAESLTIDTGDTLYTNGYDLDITTFITVNGTLDCTDDVEGDGTTINLGTNWTVATGGIFIAQESATHPTTVIFDEGTSGTITPGGTDENHDFWNFQISKSASATMALAGDLDIENNLTISNSNSTLDVSSSNYNINVGGSWSNAGVFTSQQGTVTFDASSGTVTIDSTGATTDDFYNIVFNSSGSATFQLESTLDVNNDLTISGGTLDVKSGENNTIYVGGNWENNGTFLRQSGKVYFDAASGSKTIYDGGSPFYDLEFTTSGSANWTYIDEGTPSDSPTNSTTVQSGTVVFINARTGTVTVNGGELNVDWYLGIHVVDLETSDNIDTGDNDITISENSAIPQSTVWRYNGGWGTPASSKTTGTGSDGKNPQPNSTGAIKIREYKKTSSATTYYLYNIQIAAQPNNVAYDYYDQYGNKYLTSSSNSGSGHDEVISASWHRVSPSTMNGSPPYSGMDEPPTQGSWYIGMFSGKKYITSCWSGPTNTCSDDPYSDDVIGALWYRSNPSQMNSTPPYDGLNEPPLHGSWYAGLMKGLEVTITGISITFDELNATNNFTDTADTQTTITVTTTATNGYIVTAWETQLMTCSDAGACGSQTIQNFTFGTYADPQPWEGYYCKDNVNYCGFGFTSNDPLVEGSNRYNNATEYTYFPTDSSNPVRVMDYPSSVSNQSYSITYRISAPLTQRPGPYQTTIVYVITAQY